MYDLAVGYARCALQLSVERDRVSSYLALMDRLNVSQRFAEAWQVGQEAVLFQKGLMEKGGVATNMVHSDNTQWHPGSVLASIHLLLALHAEQRQHH